MLNSMLSAPTLMLLMKQLETGHIYTVRDCDTENTFYLEESKLKSTPTLASAVAALSFHGGLLVRLLCLAK